MKKRNSVIFIILLSSLILSIKPVLKGQHVISSSLTAQQNRVLYPQLINSIPGSFATLNIYYLGAMAPASIDICSANITLDANYSGGPAPDHYQWYKNASPIPGETAASLVITPSSVNDLDDYTLIAYDISNAPIAFGLNDVTINVKTAPSINAPAQICSSTPVTLTANTSSNVLTYQWYQAPATALGTASTQVISSPGDYYLVVTHSCGSFTSPTVTITSSGTAPSGLSISTSQPTNRRCNGSSITLNASLLAGTGLSYQWYRNSITPGNAIAGATGSSYVITSADALPANYVVEVSNGCGTLNQLILINSDAPPTSVQLLPPSPSSVICNGFLSTLQTTSLVNTGSAITKYEWYNNGTLVSTTATGFYSATTSGTYTVRVYNNCGSVLSSNSQAVTVVKSPTTASITKNATDSLNIGCNTSTLRLFANSDGSPSSYIDYQWYLNGSPVGTGSFFDATIAGSYTITALDNLGCNPTPVTSLAIVVGSQVSTPSNITLSANTANACLGSVTFTASAMGSGPITFEWYKDNVLYAASTSTTLIATLSGTYKVRGSNYCGKSAFSQDITVSIVNGGLSKPSINIPGGINAACTGGSIALQAVTPNTGINYRWFRNNVLIQGATSATYNANQTGSYVVETSGASCSILSDPVNVYINSISPVTVSYVGKFSFCEGDSLVFTAISGDSTIQYTWFKNAAQIATGKTLTVKDTGSYAIKLNTKNTCGGSKDYTYQINVSPISKPIITQNGQIISTDSRSNSYQWRLNGSPIIGATSSSYKPVDAGKYSVVLTSKSGCVRISDELDIPALSDSDETIWIYPNPNDGNFYVDILNGSDVTLYLFDSKGVLIDEKTLSSNKNSLSGYKASYSNLPSGIYILKANINGRIASKKIVIQ